MANGLGGCIVQVLGFGVARFGDILLLLERISDGFRPSMVIVVVWVRSKYLSREVAAHMFDAYGTVINRGVVSSGQRQGVFRKRGYLRSLHKSLGFSKAIPASTMGAPY